MTTTTRQHDMLHRLTQAATAAAARLLGVSARTLRDWSDCPRNPDGSYHAPQIVAWRVEALLAEQKERLIVDDADVMGGPSSPALEKLRMAKALIAEHDLAVKRGQVVSSDLATQALSVVATKLRRMGERLTKKYGNELADEIDRTLDEAGAAIETQFAQPVAGVNHE